MEYERERKHESTGRIRLCYELLRILCSSESKKKKSYVISNNTFISISFFFFLFKTSYISLKIVGFTLYDNVNGLIY